MINNFDGKCTICNNNLNMECFDRDCIGCSLKLDGTTIKNNICID